MVVFTVCHIRTLVSLVWVVLVIITIAIESEKLGVSKFIQVYGEICKVCLLRGAMNRTVSQLWPFVSLVHQLSHDNFEGRRLGLNKALVGIRGHHDSLLADKILKHQVIHDNDWKGEEKCKAHHDEAKRESLSHFLFLCLPLKDFVLAVSAHSVSK